MKKEFSDISQTEKWKTYLPLELGFQSFIQNSIAYNNILSQSKTKVSLRFGWKSDVTNSLTPPLTK